MNPISTKDRLPENNTYVLAHFPNSPWSDSDCKNGEHKWVVVKFIRGISEGEREKLDASDPRKRTYTAADEHSNNRVPYYWDTFGPGSFFGQECSVWCELPNI